MNLKELERPLRIYWDLPPEPSASVDHLKICEGIIESRVLFLSLRDAASPASPACRDIISALKDRGIAVSLTVPGLGLTASSMDWLSGSDVKTLLIEVSSLDEARSTVQQAEKCTKRGLLPGLAFEVREDNYRDIPGVVAFCRENGIRDLLFPIQRLHAGRDFFCMQARERAEIGLRLSVADHRGIRITIHDPFLWAVFYPGTDYHEGGCQAANSMLYISPEYLVYPCPAMPVELGDLRTRTLMEIIMSEEKKKLRRSLLEPPGDCAACDQVRKCLGGCRGRGFVAANSMVRRDPGCG